MNFYDEDLIFCILQLAVFPLKMERFLLYQLLVLGLAILLARRSAATLSKSDRGKKKQKDEEVEKKSIY